MAQENPHLAKQPEGRIATLSHWITGSWFLPFETGLTFSTITIFLLMFGRAGTWFDYLGDWTLPVVFAVITFIPGFFLGFPLRKVLAQKGEGIRPDSTVPMLVLVAFSWLIMFLLVTFIFLWITFMG